MLPKMPPTGLQAAVSSTGVSGFHDGWVDLVEIKPLNLRLHLNLWVLILYFQAGS